MNALLLTEYMKFEMVDFPKPEAGPGEVLIEVRACGICGSDVHGMDGSSGRRNPPLIMGHEAAGQVVGIGYGVTTVQVRELAEELVARPLSVAAVGAVKKSTFDGLVSADAPAAA